MTRIAAVMMVKNEAARVHVTLASIGALDALIVYDTGSDDGTPELIERLSPIRVHMKRGAFVDFATSLNVLLAYADECRAPQDGDGADGGAYDYYVLLDSNDEFVGKRPDDNDELLADVTSWHIRRSWRHGDGDAETSVWTLRFIRARSGHRYTGAVHELLNDDMAVAPAGRCRAFRIHQDRTAREETDKTARRWPRDRELLEREIDARPHDTRTLFYLAQTYACLGECALAYAAYERRTRAVDGFEEERWFATLQCGNLAMASGHSWDVALTWYTRAFCADARAEPLVKLAEHYANAEQYRLAYAYAKLACDLRWPGDDRLMFVERQPYAYARWHLLGRVAYYVAEEERREGGGEAGRSGGAEEKDAEGDVRRTATSCAASAEAKMREGEHACRRAIAAGCNVALDTANLAWYGQ
jgi:hypothetical protein